jgi:hypothetical protein
VSTENQSQDVSVALDILESFIDNIFLFLILGIFNTAVRGNIFIKLTQS